MEERQLNFNQPFLSVRRYTPTVASQIEQKRKPDNSLAVGPVPPPYISELKSGPVTNPGAVPFIWEQTPGRPKDALKPQTQNYYDKPPIAPKLPPGRCPTSTAKANHENSYKASPNDTKSLPVNVCQESQTDPSRDEKVKSFENYKEETKEEQGTSDSGDSDEAYVDALDTLSRTESFFLNCSVSGVNGLEDTDLKPSGSFSTDQQTREFMMDRFLPAAKAMASEAPQHAPKKQPAVVREHPQERRKTVINQVKPSLRYGPSFAKRYSYYPDNEQDEESDDEYDQRANFPPICGLLPKFCLKSSLCLLNPVPAVSVRTRMPMSSHIVKSQSSTSGSFSETENEFKADISEPKSLHKIQTAELEQNNNKALSNGGSQLQNLRSLTGSNFCDSPLLVHKEKEAQAKNSGIKSLEPNGKGFKTFEELLAEQSSPEELDSEIPVVEKTLYVDTEEKVGVGPRSLTSCSPKNGDPIKVTGSLEADCNRMNQTNVISSSLEDFEKSDTINEEVKLQSNAKNSADFTVIPPTPSDESKTKWGSSILKTFGQKQNSNLTAVSTENIQLGDKLYKESDVRQHPRAKENCHRKHFEFPIPPPLPKSPSDSWLWRTLPSVSTKNASTRASLGAATNFQNQGSKGAPGEMKWEAIVKSSKLQRQNLRHTEDLLTPIPET